MEGLTNARYRGGNEERDCNDGMDHLISADYAHILSNQKIWQYLGTYNVRTVQSTRTLMVW
jgi:hypothetical protein